MKHSNHNSLSKIFFFLLSVFFFSSCSEEVQNIRSLNGVSSDLKKESSLNLIVNEGQNIDLVRREPKIEYSIAIDPESLKKEKIEDSDTIKIELTHIIQKDLINQKIESKGSKSVFNLDLSMGLNRIVIRATVESRPDLSGVWEITQIVDNENPLILSEAKISTDLATGTKFIEGAIQVTDLSDVNCGDVQLLSDELPDGMPIKLRKSTLEKDKGVQRFDLEKSPLGDKLQSNLRLRINCQDAASNLTQVEDPIKNEEFNYSIMAEYSRYEPIDSDTSDSYLFVNGSPAVVQLSLVDSKTGTLVDESILESEQKFLRVYAGYQKVDESQLDDDSLFLMRRSPFKTEISIPINENFDTKTAKLFLTITRLNVLEGTEAILHQEEIDTYFDSRGIDINLLSELKNMADGKKSAARFFSPKKDRLIEFSFSTVAQGAPVVATVVEIGEYKEKLDDQMKPTGVVQLLWEPLEIDPIMVSVNSTTSFKYRYLDSEERNIRLRIKITDAAGNLTMTEPSPQFIATSAVRADFEAVMNGTEELSADCAGKSDLVVVKSSSFLCRNPLNRDQLMQAILLKNLGEAPIMTYGDQGYVSFVVSADNVRSYSSSFVVNNSDPFPPGKEKMIYIPFSAAEFESGKTIDISFDREDSGASSIANRCRELDFSLEESLYPTISINPADTSHTNVFDCDIQL